MGTVWKEKRAGGDAGTREAHSGTGRRDRKRGKGPRADWQGEGEKRVRREKERIRERDWERQGKGRTFSTRSRQGRQSQKSPSRGDGGPHSAPLRSRRLCEQQVPHSSRGAEWQEAVPSHSAFSSPLREAGT